MAEEKFSKKTFGDTYYPITTNAMTNNRYENFANKKKEYGSESDLDKNHKKLIAKLNKEKVRPSEIAKLDKEYKSRLKQSTKDLQDRLKYRQYNDPNTKKQQSAKAMDTGSTFAKGGRAGYKDGKSVEKKGLSSRTKGSDRPSKELDFSKKNFSYSGKEMQADKKARKSRTQSQSRMNPVPYKSGGRTGYSVGGRATRGVSKILIKK